MIDISPNCGLPVWLDNANHRLVLDESLLGNRPQRRRLEELRDVLYEKDLQEPAELYTLFNDVGLPDARKLLSRYGLRYDLGIMPPLRIGSEYIKTMGHYHSTPSGTSVPYAEVYEVVHGAARFILQKQDPRDAEAVTDVIYVEATERDRLIMPPDYAHVTINPGPEALVLSNLAAADCAASYSEIARMGGLAYFDVQGEGSPTFVKNPRYREVPPIRKVCLNKLRDFGLDPGQPIYLAAQSAPRQFGFISEPQDFLHLFDEIVQASQKG